MLGDFLYELAARDRVVTPLEIFADKVSVSDTLIITTATIHIPHDRMMILRRAEAFVVAGAAQTVSQIGLVMNRDENAFPTSDPTCFIQRSFFSATTQNTLNQSFDVFVPPGATLTAYGVFSAIVNPNTCELSVMGLLIPRGNIAI